VVPVSTFLHPTGPEPPAVYWIRRGAIVLVIITVIAVLWWLVGSILGGDGGSSAEPETQPTSSASSSAAPEASSSASAAASTSAEPVECLDSAITVEATTDASTYPVGSTPRLTLTIINSGDVACKRDVGPKANELEITSGGYHVWSSDDCNASSKSKVVTLEPGEKVASSITWDGHLTAKGCPNGEGALAKAGSYDLTGRNGKVNSESTPFSLTSTN
jgi:hypothetical protein